MPRIIASVVLLLATLVILDASVYMSSPFDSPPMTATGMNRSAAKVPHTREELELDRIEKARRMNQRRANAREKIAHMQPDPSDLERLSDDELQRIYGIAKEEDPLEDKEEYAWLRRLWGKKSQVEFDPYQPAGMANPGGSYDWWAQGYRTLGPFIDCGHNKVSNNKNNNRNGGKRELGNNNNNNNNNKNNNKNQQQTACSRWMMWASYVNPNYKGGGRSEYFSNTEGGSQLDCHSASTQWVLLGVYRQEFYQYIEQISKHLWAITEYQYAVAVAGLAYMSKYECFQVGTSKTNGATVYASIAPQPHGNFQMALYTENKCLVPDTTTGYTYDDFGLTTDMCLSEKGDVNDDTVAATLYTYWQAAQEYTFTKLNQVYDEYKYCTLCLDYPTYQDGFFIGDSGTDDDDLINQCWKFHSHNSYTCDSDCMALGDAQNSIVHINYGGRVFGSAWDGSNGGSYVKPNYGAGEFSSGGSSSSSKKSTGKSSSQKFEDLKANFFLIFSGILFLATFLAYAVAKNSSPRVDKEKSRSLLTEEERERARSRSDRRKSKVRSHSRRGHDTADDAITKARSSSRSSRDARQPSRTISPSSRREPSRTISPSSRRHHNEYIGDSYAMT